MSGSRTPLTLLMNNPETQRTFRRVATRGVFLALGLALGLPGLSALAEGTEAGAAPSDPGAELRREFADYLYEDLSGTPGDGVAMKRFMEASGMEGHHPRNVRSLLFFDPNGDGRISREEMYEGITGNVMFQVDRQMGLDVDEDGQLTLEEYALQIPHDEGERDAEGYLPQMRYYFKQSDTNGDGIVTREEITEDFSRTYAKMYSGWVLGYRARVADLDGDDEVSIEEFANLHGEDPDHPSVEVQQKFRRWGGVRGQMRLANLRAGFGNMPIEEQRMMRPHVRALWREQQDGGNKLESLEAAGVTGEQ